MIQWFTARFRLIPNWWVVLKRAWTLRLMLIAAILTGAEFVFQTVSPPDWVPTWLFAASGFTVIVAAMIARFVVQKGVTNNGP